MMVNKLIDEYKIRAEDNTVSKIFGMKREDFYKLFLKCNNSSKNRVEFADNFESEYLKHMGINTKKVTIVAAYLGSDGYYHRSTQSWRGYFRENYLKYIPKCARYFQVGRFDITRLPIGDWDAPKRAQQTAQLKKYFESRPQLTIVTSHDQYIDDDCQGISDSPMENDCPPYSYNNYECEGINDPASMIMDILLDFDTEEE